MLHLHICHVAGKPMSRYPYVVYDDDDYYAALDVHSLAYDTLAKCVDNVSTGNRSQDSEGDYKGPLITTFTDYDDLVNNYPELLI